MIAEIEGDVRSISFDVINPSEESVALNHSEAYGDMTEVSDPSYATHVGPGRAVFDCIVGPTYVNFYRVLFKERVGVLVNGQVVDTTWEWPDHSTGSRPGAEYTFRLGTSPTGQHNWTPDNCTEGPYSKNVLNNGAGYQSHSHTIPVPVFYQDDTGWVDLSADTHVYGYSGSDLKAHVTYVEPSDPRGPWR